MAARSATEKVVALSLTVRVRPVDGRAAGLGDAIPVIGAATCASALGEWMGAAAAMANWAREQKREICGVLMDFRVSRPRRILKLCPW